MKMQGSKGRGIVMAERSSERKREGWGILVGAAVVLMAVGVGWRGFSSPRSALAEEPLGAPPKARHLPDDLAAVSDAKYAPLEGLAPGSRGAQDRQRQAVQQLGLPLEVKIRGIGIVFRLIPAGTFTMGSPSSESKRETDEVQHRVELTKALYCAKFEVTQGQWEQVMGSNPSQFKNVGKNGPVESVSWGECQAFVKKLCQMEGVPEGTYRLLTEAEWEYACRAGTDTVFAYGNDLDSSMANFNGNNPYGGGRQGQDRGTTVTVGSFAPNAWGLHDMHGNVWEWCQDWYGDYPSESVTDPLGPTSGMYRGYRTNSVCRGGGWFYGAWSCRSAYRSKGLMNGYRVDNVGLRLARSIPSYP
jgi:formylglycine-generating enzyme required for sulfatase activity